MTADFFVFWSLWTKNVKRKMEWPRQKIEFALNLTLCTFNISTRNTITWIMLFVQCKKKVQVWLVASSFLLVWWKNCSNYLVIMERWMTYVDKWTALLLESVQDFLIKLDIKPCMYLVEISISSLKLVIVRFTKIMNRGDKNWAHFKEMKYLKIKIFKNFL